MSRFGGKSKSCNRFGYTKAAGEETSAASFMMLSNIPQAQLRLSQLVLECVQIREYPIIVMDNSIFLTYPVEQLHQFRMVGAVDHILIAIMPDILFLQMWKFPVKLCIKIFPVALTQG